MKNEVANEIISDIKKSTYVLTDAELDQLETIEAIVNSGADVPSDEALQLENLFEKIKRGGFLQL
jgi:hypothetical protein